MRPRDRAILEAIAESARLADDYVRQQGPGWLDDSRTVDAVAKRVEHIGELAKHLSPEALAMIRQQNFTASNVAFDAAFASKE